LLIINVLLKETSTAIEVRSRSILHCVLDRQYSVKSIICNKLLFYLRVNHWQVRSDRTLPFFFSSHDQ